MVYFLTRECMPAWNAVPLCKARPATGGGGVLGNEHRVSSKRSLLAVVWRLRGSEPLKDKVTGVLEHGRQGLLPEIKALALLETKAPSERRFFQGLKNKIDTSHAAHNRYLRIICKR
jgi:hypothetical protein